MDGDGKKIVWVVMRGDYEQRDVVAVLSSESEALEHIRVFNGDEGPRPFLLDGGAPLGSELPRRWQVRAIFELDGTTSWYRSEHSPKAYAMEEGEELTTSMVVETYPARHGQSSNLALEAVVWAVTEKDALAEFREKLHEPWLAAGRPVGRFVPPASV